MEVVDRARADRGLGEGPAGAERARAADTNHAPLGVAGPGRRRWGLAAGEDRDLDPLALQEVAQVEDVLLNPSQVGVVTFGHYADAKGAHRRVLSYSQAGDSGSRTACLSHLSPRA